MPLPLCLRLESVSKERTYNGLETDLERKYGEEQGRSLKISRKNFFSGLILRFSPYIFREGASSSQYPYTDR